MLLENSIADKKSKSMMTCGHLIPLGTCPDEVLTLCPGQILIWVITFCLHKFHSSFNWRNFKSCLLFEDVLERDS